MSFAERVAGLDGLGIGLSTEWGASSTPGALDPLELARSHPRFASFLEIGIEVDKGLDDTALAWIASGAPRTYHFLDVNLDEPEDLDAAWLERVRELVERLDPAWLCGDAGLWHLGRRERGHMLLLPPVLSVDSAAALAEGIVRLREETGREVLPENPPGSVFLGDLHLLDFYAELCERADTGMLLDCAHLAIYQRMTGHDPTTGLDGFPAERIVEMHVAGATLGEHEGFRFVEDDHTPAVLDDTWSILATIAPRARELRAVVFECERNPVAGCLPIFERIERELADTPFAARLAATVPDPPR